ncbi:hypothetical protein HW090_06160 [Pseudomonas sp. ABC1]|uniref:hypothetical protein n=1 Tax=Pseudomonas sp. ABC1 TaxID=2748080 RepID=UPI0015C36723|nr:hypothetical protein [Pseudomonas sp. ABC1]QLF92797.1 hypothetical protein HW090_06160 [Pseudomonas sp. ABC1]
MNSPNPILNASNAMDYVGQTVLVEQVWDDVPKPFWSCLHIVGVVLPISGVYENSYFMTLRLGGLDKYPNELFFACIRTIRVMRYRDRHGSGNVLGRIALPNSVGSRAALPARRNGHVPANGSTGAAHP